MKRHKINLTSHTRNLAIALILTSFIFGCNKCKEDPPPAPTSNTYKLEILSGDNQIGEIETQLPEKIMVRLVNQDNIGQQGIVVNFSIPGDDGNVSPDAKVTDSDGIAEVEWFLGSKVGEQFLQAKVDDGLISTNVVEFKVSAMCENSVYYEGKDYQIVTIGTQCWFDENIDVGDKNDIVINHLDDGIIQKLCYDKTSENCNKYGGLYTWNEAMGYSEMEKSQGICPNGWHIPSKSEYEELISFLGGENISGGAMKSTLLWQNPNTGATNSSGFKALPAGESISIGLWAFGYKFEGELTKLWTSTKGSNYPLKFVLEYDSKKATIEESPNTWNLVSASCRCIKD